MSRIAIALAVLASAGLAGCSLVVDSDTGAAGPDNPNGELNPADSGTRPVPTVCPPDFTRTTGGCFLVAGGSEAAAAAALNCQSYVFNDMPAHLAVLESADEVVAARDVLAGETDAIVGLIQLEDGTWQWINGIENQERVPWSSDTDYEDYDASGRCAQLYDAVWVIQTDCATANEFLCEWDGDPTVHPIP